MSNDSSHGPEAPWYASWFDADYLKVYAKRDDDDAKRGTDLAERALAPLSGSRVLDLACGPGRHMVHLRDRGYRPTGLDLSAHLLHEAKGRLDTEPQPLVRADMRHLPFHDGAFDIVLSLFTSFGYFGDDDNQQVLTEAHRVLTPGGGLLLDVLNRAHIVKNIAPDNRRKVEDIELDERRRFDPETERLEKRIEMRSPRGVRRLTESVRLYTTAELLDKLRAAGFRAVPVFGNLQGEPFDQHTSPRLLIRARKDPQTP